jgi:hypothetical protein
MLNASAWVLGANAVRVWTGPTFATSSPPQRSSANPAFKWFRSSIRAQASLAADPTQLPPRDVRGCAREHAQQTR